MGTLYIVATPIGNLEDVSLRAVRILREVSLIAAEDTRKTRTLLSAHHIKTPLTSYFEHNKLSKLGYILEQLQTGDIALVSDAGMPGLSDPGYELIKAAVERGFPVIPVPGPSAVITAVVVSGLPTDRFLYLGFLPHKAGERQRLLDSVANEQSTLVILESPHRLKEALADILSSLGNRRAAICRELTKLHEEIFRGTIQEAIEHFQEPRGEFVLVIEGNRVEKPLLTESIEQELANLKQSGVPAKDAIARLTKTSGLSRKELYHAWLKSPKI